MPMSSTVGTPVSFLGTIVFQPYCALRIVLAEHIHLLVLVASRYQFFQTEDVGKL